VWRSDVLALAEGSGRKAAYDAKGRNRNRARACSRMGDRTATVIPDRNNYKHPTVTRVTDCDLNETVRQTEPKTKVQDVAIMRLRE
jgi:hypothetical protein